MKRYKTSSTCLISIDHTPAAVGQDSQPQIKLCYFITQPSNWYTFNLVPNIQNFRVGSQNFKIFETITT